MIAQLDLFASPPAAPTDHPGHFFAAGWRIWYVEDMPYGGAQMHGWRAARIDDAPDAPISGAYSPAALRRMLDGWAKAVGLPMDLYARGWQRDGRPGYTHWLHWPENGVSCCFDDLDRNIAAARRMRPLSELRARAEAARQAAQKPAKKTRRAA